MQLAAHAGSSRGVLLLGDCWSLHSLHGRFGPEPAGAYFSRYLSNTIHRRHNVKTVISSHSVDDFQQNLFSTSVTAPLQVTVMSH